MPCPTQRTDPDTSGRIVTLPSQDDGTIEEHVHPDRLRLKKDRGQTKRGDRCDRDHRTCHLGYPTGIGECSGPDTPLLECGLFWEVAGWMSCVVRTMQWRGCGSVRGTSRKRRKESTETSKGC